MTLLPNVHVPQRVQEEDPGKPVFRGAYGGSNDAYWTKRVALHRALYFAHSLHNDLDLNTAGVSSIVQLSVLVRVDFKGNRRWGSNNNVRKVGITTLSSDDPIHNDIVIALSLWHCNIKV
jgi:hypothetical protein